MIPIASIHTNHLLLLLYSISIFYFLAIYLKQGHIKYQEFMSQAAPIIMLRHTNIFMCDINITIFYHFIIVFNITILSSI